MDTIKKTGIDLRQLGDITKTVASMLTPGMVIVLNGTLGAGKTTFVRCLAQHLGITDNVCSPTFGLVQQYNSSPPIVHLDVYRLNSEQELDFLDLDYYMDGTNILFIEWGSRFESIMQEADVMIDLTVEDDPDKRSIHIKPLNS